jgi:hypothetical protein
MESTESTVTQSAKEGQMPLMRRRPLMRAAMVGGAGYAAGKHQEAGAEAQAEAPAQAPAPATPATSEAGRIDALTKLKSLLDSGVLTEEQFESERARLTEGI